MRVLGALIFTAVLVGIAAGIAIGAAATPTVVAIAVTTALLLGFPAYLALRKLGWLQPWQLSLTGVLLVSPWFFVVGHEWMLSITIAVSGATAGLIFWWIGLSRSPRTPRAEA